ncbi:MAG: tRNA (adenosine(37)-N6)-dimethylallyltransferase MiaA [Ruminiclostridium sp.]|jgi:tRNA dimethylallyltransferase|nr:tRNA (adenosine(37)-N6)-dimethylallyltransferase MiaA [Ruminiclostridium sp.]MCI9465743.1 tRNA (adenosine(37)-N6)-dimethylallyltransferase MiaA [Ruminiclostridium sp.]
MAPPIIVVCGPTATGKTKLGVALAQRFHGEVVSADSMQLYRGMAIGTAQPTPEEMGGIPHHMLAVADPREPYSVGRYVEEAGRCLEDILRRGKQPILVGGTGLYIDSLLSGRDFSPKPPGNSRARLQARAAQEGLQALWTELQGIDPAAAARVHPNDEKRILRALEVWYDSGETISQHNQRTQAVPPRYQAVTLILNYRERQDLYARIDQRVDEMMARGLLDEAKALLANRVPQDATAMQAIGYKELLPALAGQCPLEDAVALVKLRSRQYAKRQLSWFRRNQGGKWFYLEKIPNFPALLQDSTDFVREKGVG